MNKKIFYLIIFLLFGTYAVNAQTVQIEDAVTAPGEISVQVDMLDFTGDDGDVAAITMYIEYDSDLLSFVEISDTQLTGSWLANYNADDDQLVITYQATPLGTGYDIDGKLLDLVFDYVGGFSTDVTFGTGCEVANSSLASISATWVDGSVTQSAAVGTVSMDSLTELIGTTVSMPVAIQGSGFGSVDAITFKVNYDTDELSYAGIVEDAITGVTANAAGGMLTIEWTGTAIDFTSSDTLVWIKFVYYGGEADAAFYPGCEISSGLAPLATDYEDGFVEQAPQSAQLEIESVGGTPGASVGVPIEVYDIGQTLGSISLHVGYDNTKLTYTGYTANQLSGWVVTGLSGGVINIEWSSGTGSTVSDGDLITLNFNYAASGGIANIVFNPGNEVKTINLVNIPVTYVDGLVGGYKVSGNVAYYSSGLVIPNTTVYLKKQSDNSIYKTESADASGDFEFTGVVPGDYYLDASTTADAQFSYDQTDAFLIYGIGGTFTGLVETAADVNEDLVVDQTDAFIVYGSWLNGNVKVVSWTAPDWVFENPNFTVSSNVTQDFSGLCSGDVNADYVPIP
ncbi:MAG: hypothetical protein K9G67_15440 [Bacteroidales bacterium]|nr:hypothetical protein [Bacteroidales bacterium]MCF8344041.1 hypothetical protein [Bacteroidales bacterium]MCF8351590.1 hypothetical protein [Bacteroidales bacterium]MCF8377749.1 hypothetical protein [Bacteroidales bacterium]